QAADAPDQACGRKGSAGGSPGNGVARRTAPRTASHAPVASGDCGAPAARGAAPVPGNPAGAADRSRSDGTAPADAIGPNTGGEAGAAGNAPANGKATAAARDPTADGEAAAAPRDATANGEAAAATRNPTANGEA